jgi:hypothetical protein
VLNAPHSAEKEASACKLCTKFLLHFMPHVIPTLTSMMMGHTHSRATATVVSFPTELVKTAGQQQQRQPRTHTQQQQEDVSDIKGGNLF